MITKASIIIPVYNGSDYLKEAIDSALAQTYKNIEIVVVNDGSNDGGKTEKIAKSYGKKIRYFNKKNGGVSTALNLGIKKMKGNYFSWLSHDDVYKKDKIKSQIDYLKKIKKDVVVYSDYENIDQHSNLIKQRLLKHISPENFKIELLKQSFLHGCTLLIPKKFIDQVGYFNSKYRTTQDYYYWFKLAALVEFHHLPQVLVSGRIHQNQGTRTLKDTSLKERDNLHLFFVNNVSSKEIKRYTKNKPTDFYLNLANSYSKTGYIKASRKSLFKAYENYSFKEIKITPKLLLESIKIILRTILWKLK